MTPPEDRAHCPYTGWTREHWGAVADRMLTALDPYWSPGGARIDLPGMPSRNGAVSDGLEGFARTFLLAGFRVTGERGADPGGLMERYARGLAAGTDPGSPEAWPRPDEVGQAKVEAASVALVLQMTRPWLWDRLDDVVRERIVAWLGTVVGQPYPPINWVWFRIVVESFLREAGGPWSAEDIEQDLAVHQSLRRANGWLSDGQERSYDHYTGWALHTYPLLWTHLFDVTGSLCPQELRDQWSADLARYLDDAAVLVGADGSPLMQGRSLAYRFAAAAPFWVGGITGDSEPGLVRRIASGMLRHFVDNGAIEPDGVLRLGWHGEWPAIRQSYSGPGSPYWAAKGMLGLAVPADHPLWTDVECPLPVEKGDVARVISAPGWLVSARHDTGIATVVNHGTDHALPGDTRSDAPMYARLAYSTATIPPLAGTDPVDNSVGLLDDNGLLSHRAGFRALFSHELPGGVLAGASTGTVRWVDTSADDSPDHGSGRTGPVRLGPPVLVASVVRDGVEIRLARVDGETSAPLRLSGWPVTADRQPHTEVEAGPWIAVHGAAIRSGLCGLRGFGNAGVDEHADASPLGAFAATPWLATSAAVVPGQVLVAAVWLDRGGPRPPIPAVDVEHDVISLRWSDGLDTQVTLPNP